MGKYLLLGVREPNLTHQSILLYHEDAHFGVLLGKMLF